MSLDSARPLQDQPLRLGVIPTIGPFLLPSLMPVLREAFPRLRLYLREDTTARLVDRLETNRLDVLLLALPCDCGSADASPVARDEFLVALPAGHRLARADQAAMAELNREAWIVCPASTLGRLVLAMCVSAGFQPDLAASVDDIGTAVGLVGIGWGVTIAPQRTPAGTGMPVARIPIAGVSTARHSILMVRDGEHLLPWIAAAATQRTWPSPTAASTKRSPVRTLPRSRGRAAWMRPSRTRPTP